MPTSKHRKAHKKKKAQYRQQVADTARRIVKFMRSSVVAPSGGTSTTITGADPQNNSDI